MARAFIAPSALVVVLLAPAAGHAVRFTTHLDSLRLTARPGDVITRTRTLTLGAEEKRTQFRVHVEDWHRSEDGQKSFYLPPGTLGRSAAPWVAVNPVEAAVEPDGSLNLRVTIAVPRDVSPGGYWCALTIDEVGDPGETIPGVEVRFLASVSTGIFVDIEPVHRAAAITDVRLEDGRARVVVRNDGDTPLGIEGRLEFLPPEGGARVAAALIPRETVLTEPVRTGFLHAALPPLAELPPGRYLVRVVLDIGLDHYIGVQKEIEVRRDPASD